MEKLINRASSLVPALTVAVLLSLASPVVATGTGHVHGGDTSSLCPEEAGPTDPAEMEAFLDELIPRQLSEFHAPGAAISVVREGKLFFAKGYGYADLAEKTPVEADQTVFRIGSVSKMFTWTAVMQLVEQGKLDLEVDVNDYLDFRIPETYSRPITVKNLITHTSGFEDKLLGSLFLDPREEMAKRDWLIAHMPVRVHPPGEFAGYANYNAVLAGYIVERVSGEAYDQYVQNHILSPLGMTRSAVSAAVPTGLRPYMSASYTYSDGAIQAFPEYTGQPAGLPSGAVLLTVTDMARFMIALLNGGRYSDATTPEVRILEESTAREMLTTQYTPDPRLRGTALGVSDWTDNGQWTLGHTGYFPQFRGVLLLLPDQNLGVYAVYNSKAAGEGSAQHAGLQRAFFDHYYPAPPPAPVQPPAGFAAQANRFVGTYGYASSPYSSLIKVIELFGAYRAEVSDPGDGTLALSVEGTQSRYVQVDGLYFRQVDGSFGMLFRENERGQITSLYADVIPQYSLIKLKWYEATGFSMGLMLSCLLVFASMILVMLIRGIRSILRRGRPVSTPGGASTAPWILLAISVLDLLVVIGFMFWGEPETELGSISLLAKIALGLGVISAVLTAVALFYLVLVWKDRYWGRAARLYFSIVTMAGVAFVWLLNYWNLLGWRY
jgi:CubicO group peptidase (beta-lactamase class C family)